MGFMGLGDFLDAAAYLGVAGVEGFEGGGVALVVARVENHVFGCAFEYGCAADGIVAGIDSEILTEHGAGPGERTAAALRDEVGARYAPDLTHDVDDFAGQLVVDISCWCGHDGNG